MKPGSAYRSALIRSTALHALGVLGAWLAVRHHPSTLIPAKPAPFEVTLREAPPTAPRGAVSGRRHGPPSRSRSVPPLRSLGIGAYHPPRGSDAPGVPEGRGSAPVDGYAVANAMPLEKEAALYPFFQALWQRIDAVTTYPPDFVQRRIRGSVTVHLSVSRKGEFTGRFLDVHATDPWLKAYVMALLAHGLREPLPERAWSAPGKEAELIVVTRFDFDLFGPGGVAEPAGLPHLKNILAFRRSAYAEPLLKQEIERIMTHYLPPIIPVPGGFYIDFLRAYELVRNWSRPEQVDPGDALRQRLASDRDRWESVVRRGDRREQENTGETRED